LGGRPTTVKVTVQAKQGCVEKGTDVRELTWTAKAMGRLATVDGAGAIARVVAVELMRDIAEKARRGEGRGLIQDVINRFGKVVGLNGELLYSYDTNRVDAFLWKVVRGLYALELCGTLPEMPPDGIELMIPRQTPEKLDNLVWFPMVRNTEPMGRYGRVFDYKWLSWKDGGLRGHAFAMLFWDRLLGAMLFHDPTCECGNCDDWKQGRMPPQESQGQIAGTNRA